MSRFIYCYAECHYAECCYAECRGAWNYIKIRIMTKLQEYLSTMAISWKKLQTMIIYIHLFLKMTRLCGYNEDNARCIYSLLFRKK